MRAMVPPLVVVATILGINPTYARPATAPVRPAGTIAPSGGQSLAPIVRERR